MYSLREVNHFIESVSLTMWLKYGTDLLTARDGKKSNEEDAYPFGWNVAVGTDTDVCGTQIRRWRQ